MDPDDSDYQSSVSHNQYDSGSDHSSHAGRSVILGEDGDDYVRDEFRQDSASDHSPRRKRSDDEPHAARPFKRQRSALNLDYLDLLNRDIDDAAHRVCLDDDTTTTPLPASQLGLTYWSPLEKKQFFEALSRLGRHDLQGIADRVGTKSPVEVKHYLRVLQEAVRARRAHTGRSFLVPAEYPAAVELTPLCCHAQEEAADAISIKQEARECRREEAKWQAYWDITPKIAAALEKQQRQQQQQDEEVANLAFAKLFHVSRWLKLSDRMFMNSSIPGSNWRSFDSKPPSMWAATLDDFHSLALSITRRLVHATLFISMSRIRAKSVLRPGTRNIVRKKDVEAAIASLGLSHNSDELWLKSARRLRLDVYEEPPISGEEEEEEEEKEPMSYDEVEAELADEPPPHRASSVDSDIARVKFEPQSTRAVEDEDDDSAGDYSDDDHPAKPPPDVEGRAVNREVNEILWYSAVGRRDLQSTRRDLTRRVEMERQQERQADAADDVASFAAETGMWELLQKAPPAERPRMPNPTVLQRSNLDVEGLYPMNRAWADDLEYRAEWETLQKPVEQPVSQEHDDDYD